MPRTRRSLLQRSGIALGSGALASLAGCIDTPVTGGRDPDDSPAGGSSPTDDPTPTGVTDETPLSALTQWLPNPASTLLRDGYGVRLFDAGGIRRHRDAMHENAYARLVRQMQDPIPRYVDAADVTATVAAGDTGVALGSFDPDAVANRITGDRGTSTGSPTTPTRTPRSGPEAYRGFDLYGDDVVYAVSEDVVLEAAPMGPDADATAHAEAVIDAGVGEADRYPDGNDYVAAMLGTLDDADAVWCYPEAMDGSTTRGFRAEEITGGLKAWRFGGETTHLTFANTYADAETVTAEKLSSYIEAEADRFGPYEGIDVQAEGLLVWTDGDIPTGEFDHLSAGGPEDGVTTPN